MSGAATSGGARLRVVAAAIALAAAAFATPGPTRAAEAPAQKAAPAAKSPPAATAVPAGAPGAPAATLPPIPPAPYEPQLLRLSEMMGALVFLRDLCGAGDSADFRAKMAALIDAEAADAGLRDRLAGAYNKGFRDYAASYRTCGPAADAVIQRYLSETARLAADLASRYGG